MKKSNLTRSARQQNLTVSQNPATQRAVATAVQPAQTDTPDRIEVGDTVATKARQGGDVGGVVVAVFDEITVFKTDSGFDVQDADDLFVVSKARPVTPANQLEPITSQTHRFEVGDVVTDGNNEAPNGIAIAVFRNDTGQGDVVVWMHADGTLSTWYADDVELVTRGPVPDTERMLQARKLDLYPPGQSAQAIEPKLLANLIGYKEHHDPENEYEPATLHRMIAAAGKLDRAQMLLQQITDLIISPIQDAGDIGWQWSDEIAADWAAAFISRLRDSIGDLQTSVRCAIASKANEGQQPKPEPPTFEPVYDAGDIERTANTVTVRRIETANSARAEVPAAKRIEINRELFDLVSSTLVNLSTLQDYCDDLLVNVDTVARNDALSLAEGLRVALANLLNTAIAEHASQSSLEREIKLNRQNVA